MIESHREKILEPVVEWINLKIGPQDIRGQVLATLDQEKKSRHE